jgi:hypothetical protein
MSSEGDDTPYPPETQQTVEITGVEAYSSEHKAQLILLNM